MALQGSIKLDDRERQKLAAATEAVKLVEPGMKLGLGTGSTAAKLVQVLGERVRGGLDVLCVPTSEATRSQAEAAGIRLSTLDETPHLDLTIDGTDEIDPMLTLIKGAGGALRREKIVATASDRMVVIADVSKKVPILGQFPLPVEVVPFGVTATRNMVAAMVREIGYDGTIAMRKGKDGKPFVTENGNFILDCQFGRIGEPLDLAAALRIIPGVVEHGLFIGLCDQAFIAGPKGVEMILAPGLAEPMS
jgi:ribose 5-phosphate isomerase A